MNYILKYEPDTVELIEISKTKDQAKIGYVQEENATYIPCKSYEEAIKIYKSILRENINYLKKEKRKINIKLLDIKNKLQEIEKNEK